MGEWARRGHRLLVGGISLLLCCAPAAAQKDNSAANPNNVEEITTEAATETTDPVLTLDRPFYNQIQRFKKQMSQQHGWDWALSDNTIYQVTSGGIEHNHAGENTLSFFSLWKFIRDPNGIDGAGIGFQAEVRGNFTSDQFTEMRGDLGTLWSPNDSTSDNYSQIKQLWFATRFGQGALTLIAGKIDPGAHINENKYAGSDASQFFGQPLATNPARAFPSNGIGAMVRFVPADWLYIHAVVSDSDADSNYSPFKTIAGNWFYAGEIGLTPTIAGLGKGQYCFMVWERDTDGATGSGFGLSFGQELGERFGVFLRYAVQNGGLKNIEQIASTGVAFLSPFGRVNDEAGIGVSWTRPDDSDLRDEYAGEVYYRLQLTEGIELSASLQLIVDPSASDNDLEAVYGTRLRFLY